MSAQSFTNLELDAPFPNGILPDSIDASNRNSSGLLTDTSVNSIVKSLKSRGIIPVLSTINNNEHVYRSKVDTLLKSCKKEYDHFYYFNLFCCISLYILSSRKS